MKKRIWVRVLLGMAAFVLLFLFLTTVVVEPWIGRKVSASISEKSGDYTLNINEIRVSVFRSGIVLKNVHLFSKPDKTRQPGLSGTIESVRFNGIHLVKALFRKVFHVMKLLFLTAVLQGKCHSQRRKVLRRFLRQISRSKT
jgi:hypothetical protein